VAVVVVVEVEMGCGGKRLWWCELVKSVEEQVLHGFLSFKKKGEKRKEKKRKQGKRK
jgi:hypothetical protein